MKRIIILIFAGTFIFVSSFFASADEEESRQKHKDYSQPNINSQTEATTVSDKFKTSLSLGAVEGYDNNAFLDSKRKGDLFDQALADLAVKYRASDDLNVKAVYNFSSITYHEYTVLSVIDNDLSASFEYYIGNNIKAELGYNVDFIHYINDDEGDFYTDGPFGSLRLYLSPTSYIGGRYQYKLYDYDKQKIRLGGNKESSIAREDKRHLVTAEGAKYFDKFSLKIKNLFSLNDSNNEYMDYYDYWSNKTMGYITYNVNDKLYLLLNGGYQRKEYESRQITTSNKAEEDDLMILGCGLYCEIMPKLYLSASYTYRQNYSNDPFQEYSGSITTAGINYFF